MITGLDHVQVSCPAGSEDQLRDFYVGVLGMTELVKPPVLAARGGAWFGSGSCEIHCGVEAGFRPATKAHPGIAVSDLDELAARCEAAGCEVVWSDDIPGVRRFHVADAVGNRLELLQRDGGQAGKSEERCWLSRNGNSAPRRTGASSSAPLLSALQALAGRLPISVGLASRPARPFQARLTRCAATSSRLGLRVSSQY